MIKKGDIVIHKKTRTLMQVERTDSNIVHYRELLLNVGSFCFEREVRKLNKSQCEYMKTELRHELRNQTYKMACKLLDEINDVKIKYENAIKKLE